MCDCGQGIWGLLQVICCQSGVKEKQALVLPLATSNRYGRPDDSENQVFIVDPPQRSSEGIGLDTAPP